MAALGSTARADQVRRVWTMAVGGSTLVMMTALVAAPSALAAPKVPELGTLLAPKIATPPVTVPPGLAQIPPSIPQSPGSLITGKSIDPNGPQGMDTEGAFSTYTHGDPQTVVAYVEGGINWQLAAGLVDHIYVNWHELPIPCTGATMVIGGVSEPCHVASSPHASEYDVTGTQVDGTPVVNAGDWAHDPRVSDTNHNGVIDPEDLIVRFSCFDAAAETAPAPDWTGGVLHCSNGAENVSNDGSGFPHDISGWNFYNQDNDPATSDATYPHSDGEMANVASYCPDCMIMPVKAGAEALDNTDTLAQAWLYAGHAGASVITSVTADLGYSSFMAQAVQWLAGHGVAMVEASNDFDSTDHQGGMFWPGVVPGNGVVADQSGTGWVRSDTTSWGTHNMFDVAGQSTTSSSTAVMGGLFGLLMSFGRQEYERGKIVAPLTGLQAVQLLRETATPFTSTSLAWPGAPGDWSEQYGYGIANLDKAMATLDVQGAPPVAAITSPAWYSLEDPTQSQTLVPVTGTVSDGSGAPVSYTLQYGLGPQPQQWTTIGSGTVASGYSGPVGALDLAAIPRSFWSAPFTVSQDKTLSTADQYDVTLRLLSHAGALSGVDRRSIDVTHDSSWSGGTPLKLASSGESEPALADLQGSGRLDVVFGTSDGTIEAIDPASGAELPGWPVTTDTVSCAICTITGLAAPHDAVLSDVAVGDLRHDGHLEVVVSTLGGYVYVFDAHGQVQPGWPKATDTGVVPVPVPRPALAYSRLPVQGAVASPVLVALQPHSPDLDIVQAAWDGYMHAWTPGDGVDISSAHRVPGWPVRIQAPTAAVPKGYDLIADQKLDATPAVAYFSGPGGPPTLVERSQYSFTKGSGLQFLASGFVYAVDADGHLRAGWPAKIPGLAEYYGSAQEFVTEGTTSAQAADVTGGHGHDEVALATTFSPPVLVDGSGHIVSTYGAVAPGIAQLASPQALSQLTAQEHLPDVPVSFGTSGGAFGHIGGVLSFATPESGLVSLAASEELSNAGMAINEYESVFPAVGGTNLPGFPQSRMGLDFLGAPLVAPVGNGAGQDVIDGGDSDGVTAYGALGTTTPGFPKWTTGWDVFSPAVGDLTGDGHNDLVTVTREGYLFIWNTHGSALSDNQWWRWQHDEYNSANAATVSRPPGAITGLAWHPGQARATWVAPGLVWYDGKVRGYTVTFSGAHGTTTRTLSATATAAHSQSIAVPAGTTSLTVQAVGQGGLVDAPDRAF